MTRMERLTRILDVLDDLRTAVEWEVAAARKENNHDPQAGCAGKKRYRTVEAAGASAAMAKERRGVSLRVYQCPACQAFHLTKDSIKDFATRVAS